MRGAMERERGLDGGSQRRGAGQPSRLGSSEGQAGMGEGPEVTGGAGRLHDPAGAAAERLCLGRSTPGVAGKLDRR